MRRVTTLITRVNATDPGWLGGYLLPPSPWLRVCPAEAACMVEKKDLP